MDISDKYIEELPIDSIDACHKVIEDAFAAYNKTSRNAMSRLNVLNSYYTVVQELATNIPDVSNISEPSLSTDHVANVNMVIDYLQKVKAIINVELTKRKAAADAKSIDEIRERFRMHTREEFCYSFTDDEIKYIQSKINTLRDLVSNNSCFTNEHRQRLLKRLERLQQEMHKKVSDLDRFWGLIGDAGVMLGKFGRDAKPLVDTIKDLTDCIWKAQTRSEQIEYKAMKLLDELS